MEGSVIKVSDPADPRLRDYLGLRDPQLRRATESSAGLFIAEGELVVRRAVAAGLTLRSMLLAPARVADLADLIEVSGAPAYAASRDVLERLTGFDVHRGVLAAVDRPPQLEPGDLLARSRRIAVIEDVNNHTNLGAVFRSAAALGLDAVLLDGRSVDPLYRRTVRVSMGAVLAVPWARLSPWPAGLTSVRAAGFTVLALTPDPAAEDLGTLDLSAIDRVAVLLGAEGPGLSAAALMMADRRVGIPMAAGVDSLNVAAAAAIALYLLSRQRPAPSPW